MGSNVLTAESTQQNMQFRIGQDGLGAVSLGASSPLVVICGPCVIESRDHTLRHADAITRVCRDLGVQVVFKASYDKANRTSVSSFRGPGVELGLKILQEVHHTFEVPVVTDIHSATEATAAGEVVDMLQIPAFLCRQTDLLLAAGSTGLPTMVKKGQFLAPADMKFAADKVVEGGSDRVVLCERGSCFGYRELVVDFRSFQVMSDIGWPVVFDATHSVQQMGGAGGSSSGSREYIPGLARAAVAFGVNGVFLECHEDPANAPSDGANMIPLGELPKLLSEIKQLDELRLKAYA